MSKFRYPPGAHRKGARHPEPRDAAELAAGTGPVRVRCQGDWHVVEVCAGHLLLHVDHTPDEHRREEALRAFGGTTGGCFAARHAWDGHGGRLPKALRRHRTDLWMSLTHGGDRTLSDLLDLGLDPGLRDSEGGCLLHHSRSFDWVRQVPRLLEAGLDVNDRDRAGATPLLRAVHDDWPIGAVEVLLAAGADPDLPSDSETPREFAKRLLNDSWRRSRMGKQLVAVLELVRDHPGT